MNSKVVSINLPNCNYDILINNSRFDFDSVSDKLANRKIAVITNDTVAPLYLESLCSTLEDYNSSVYTFILRDGEQYKNMESWSAILDFLADNQFNRSDLLVSLGGGVICDMTGYAASSWMRGVDFIQVPTTLLAQVDASVGGKTGINHPKGKNLLGAFYQPQAVIINTATLNTLSEREFKSGMGEVIKYGLIDQPDFIKWLEDNSQAINNHNIAVLSEVIASCCGFKADIVQQDEKESGIRALLNLGHTFAHAIETETDYKRYTHGEAVAIGMHMSAHLSVIMNHADGKLVKTVENLLSKFNLQATLPFSINASRLVTLMRLDKKVQNNVHRLILLKKAGAAYIQSGVCEKDILQAIINCQE